VHSGPAGSEVYQGAFGEWRVEESDVKEVLGYRAGISVAAVGMSSPLMRTPSLTSHVQGYQDADQCMCMC